MAGNDTGTKSRLRDQLGTAAALIFLAGGAVLVNGAGVSVSDVSQSARIIGGATLVALGLSIMHIILSSRWKLKRALRHRRSRNVRSI